MLDSFKFPLSVSIVVHGCSCPAGLQNTACNVLSAVIITAGTSLHEVVSQVLGLASSSTCDAREVIGYHVKDIFLLGLVRWNSSVLFDWNAVSKNGYIVVLFNLITGSQRALLPKDVPE